jgi:uncharacterized protein
MTSFRIEELVFGKDEVDTWAPLDPRYRNWPVVYALGGSDEIYVGESLNVAKRFRQHLDSPQKKQLTTARVVLDEMFNKSACLDLESYLIRLLAGDDRYQVLNRNEGITDADYYGREQYQKIFGEIFEELRSRGLFTRSIPEIENTELYKLSPFKALTPDQASAVEDIIGGLFADIASRTPSRIVIAGDPGTGKTVVAIYLMKLLTDIKAPGITEPSDSDSALSEFFVEGYPELLRGFRVGLVVPQQSLRKSIQNVFRNTPGLGSEMVLTPFDVGESSEKFDLLIVDETHRLNHRANQPSAKQNTRFAEINKKLFREDGSHYTQLDWITEMSDHQIFLLDVEQSVRPADIPAETLRNLHWVAEERRRFYRLTSQMRVQAGVDYVRYVREVLSALPPEPRDFPGYDLRFYDDLKKMRRDLREADRMHGLARLVAGYAWPWRSKGHPEEYDIEVDSVRLRWNRVQVDWVNSIGSVDEVGSIHTIQGYDLNYAGVIIGNDLRYDVSGHRLYFDRSSYYDAKGKENNRALGITYTDQDLLRYVCNIYAVLLTRGIRGTYVYVCDPGLREFLRPLFRAPDATLERAQKRGSSALRT